MTGQDKPPRTELYDSKYQPVTYAVVHGMHPEIREKIIPYDVIDRGEFNKMKLNRIRIGELFSRQPSLARQLTAYETRVLLRRLSGNPDPEGESFLSSPFYEEAKKQAEREERIR